MTAFNSSVDPNSAEFANNRELYLAAYEKCQAAVGTLWAAAEAKRELLEGRGQMMPRDRLNLVLDKGAPFLEVMPLAGYQMDNDKDGSSSGGSYITGIGFVSGIRCAIMCSNYAIKGGSITPSGMQKTLRLHQIADENNLPMLNLVESAGGDLTNATGVFVWGGASFRNQARMSAKGLPQITVVHGSSTAGGAYLPGLSDYVVVVRKQSKMFLAGAPLLKAATGEIADEEELGGADMHATISGTAEYVGEDDADALRIARQIFKTIPWNEQLPVRCKKEFKEPLLDIDELMGIVPADYRQPFDCREIMARLADGSEVFEFKELFDTQTICAHANVGGYPVGFIGNNGPITPHGSNKAAQFIQLCCQSNTPLVYLQNTTGFMVGKDSEQNGMIKHGSKMVQAVSNATVPQITFMVGGGFGAGNYGMCGRSYDPRLLFAWPCSRVAVMGGEQAAMVLDIVAREKAKRQGVEPDEAKLNQAKEGTIERMDRESEALFGTARLWDDGIIDPRDTRKILMFALEMFKEAELRPLQKNTFGVARM